jgi:hypothetical protein
MCVPTFVPYLPGGAESWFDSSLKMNKDYALAYNNLALVHILRKVLFFFGLFIFCFILFYFILLAFVYILRSSTSFVRYLVCVGGQCVCVCRGDLGLGISLQFRG